METSKSISPDNKGADNEEPRADQPAGGGLRWIWGLFLTLLVLPASFFLSPFVDVARDEEHVQRREFVHRADRLLTGIEREFPPWPF